MQRFPHCPANKWTSVLDIDVDTWWFDGLPAKESYRKTGYEVFPVLLIGI
jgi:hypothetical protein